MIPLLMGSHDAVGVTFMKQVNAMKKVPAYLLALLVGWFIFVGLPVLAWGIGDVSQFLAHPARLGYVLIIAILQVGAIVYNPQVGRNREERQNTAAAPRLDLLLIQLLSLGLVLVAPYTDKQNLLGLNLGDGLRFAGLVLLVPGFVLMQMAEKYLARQFSVAVTLQKDHQLIQTGPYKLIRHPRYLGILLFFMGIALVFRSLLGVAMVLALFGVLVWRIGAEEKLMGQAFGEEWDVYRRKSWRLLPFVF